MKLTRTWYVVADGGRGRILARDGQGSMNPVLDHDFVAPHLPDRELTSDRAGRARPGPHQVGHGYRHGASWSDHARENLAHDLADVVKNGMRRNLFDKLCLVAPPEMLGVLRHTFGPQACRRVSAQIGKNLTHIPTGKIPDYLERSGFR